MKPILAAIAVVFLASNLSAQKTGAPVEQVNYPYEQPTLVIDYSGANAIYIGYATAKQPSFSWTVAASTLTSIAVATNVGTVTTSTAHGLAIGNPVIVTGSTTSALNRTYRIATVPSGTTFTITTSGVSDGTYNTAALVVSTIAPRTTAAIWSISCLQYSGANLIYKGWVNGVQTPNQIWANRATLPCQ
jgi:hypothetical protein